MSNRLNDAYEKAVETHGQEAADRAAQTSIEVFNTTAIAGMECKMCEDEQFAAFVWALDE
jgi:hypothetical protein